VILRNQLFVTEGCFCKILSLHITDENNSWYSDCWGGLQHDENGNCLEKSCFNEYLSYCTFCNFAEPCDFAAWRSIHPWSTFLHWHKYTNILSIRFLVVLCTSKKCCRKRKKVLIAREQPLYFKCNKAPNPVKVYSAFNIEVFFSAIFLCKNVHNACMLLLGASCWDCGKKMAVTKRYLVNTSSSGIFCQLQTRLSPLTHATKCWFSHSECVSMFTFWKSYHAVRCLGTLSTFLLRGVEMYMFKLG